MIIGNYPCCGETLMINLPDAQLPKLAPDTCEYCGARIWHLFSRIEPKTWTEEEFLKEYEVNEETKSVKPRISTGSAE